MIELVKQRVGDIPIFLNIPEFPFKAKEVKFLAQEYTLNDITSELGLTEENVFELLAKKIVEYFHLNEK